MTREQAREAWGRATACLSQDDVQVHGSLVLGWSPVAVWALGWLWLRGTVEPDRPLWTLGTSSLAELALWLALVAVLAYAGAKAQVRLAAELGSEPGSQVDGGVARACFLCSCGWTVALLAGALAASGGCFPRSAVAGVALLVAMALSAVQNEVLVPLMATRGSAAPGALARAVVSRPASWLSYLGVRMLLGLVAATATALFLALPLLILAALWVTLSLLVMSVLMAQVGNWPGAGFALVAFALAAALEAALARRARDGATAALRALVACFWTAMSGYRKVLFWLFGCLVVGLGLHSLGVKEELLEQLLVDGYLNLLLVVFLGRLLLAASTPALVFLRFLSLGWLERAGLLIGGDTPVGAKLAEVEAPTLEGCQVPAGQENPSLEGDKTLDGGGCLEE